MCNCFEGLAENSPDGIARFDLQGRFIYVNPATERMLARRREQILGKTNEELGIPPRLAAQARKDLHHVARSGETLTRTYSFPPGERYYEARLVPEHDGNDGIVSVLSISRDVTGRIHVADQLRDQRDFARELVNTVREPMLVLDPQYRIKSANRSFESRFDIGLAELEGKALDEVVAGRFKAEGLEMLLSRILGPVKESFEGFDIEMEVPGRGLRTIRLNARQIDHLQFILLAMEDVTPQIEAISGLRLDLRRRNVELVHQAKRLRQLVVELSETEDRERQRLADLLHDDLQQMLVGVGFHLQMAQKRCEGDSKCASLLSESRQLLSEVIEKSRNLSHELSPATFRTQGLRGGLQWLAKQMERQHRLQVQTQVSGDVDEMSEPIRILLYKAIREMLFNIVKHAEVDRAAVLVARKQDHAEVVVQDHGMGFDVDAVLENKSGRGLGLFNIRERLNLLGGHLDVESTKGEGSRFRLVVPLGHKTLEEASQRSQQMLDAHEAKARAEHDGTLCVLVVDDHSVVREGISRLLEDHPSIEVVGTAANGREAIEMLGEHELDLVLMDYAMPELNGVEATRQIKQRWPQIGVVGLSMYHEDGMADQMLKAGADGFVQKTSPVEELVGRMLEISGDGSPAGATS
jgi:PAS domain S-box-containing protein